MLSIPITADPNQSLSFNADGAYWQMHIYQAIESMCVDIKRNGVDIICGSRIFGGQPVLPFAYQYTPGFGNFIFDGDTDWTMFGLETNLFYLDATELAQYNAAILGV